MRLAVKIFLATLVVQLVLIEVAVWSLVAVNRLVQANRRIVTETMPALKLEAEAEEAIESLIRLRARWVTYVQKALVADAMEYERLWFQRAAALDGHLDGLARTVASEEDHRMLAKVRAAFGRYRALATETAGAETRLRFPDGESHLAAGAAAARVQTAVRRLGTATAAVADRSQRRAAELEERTWKTVLVALPLSVVLALGLSALIALRITRALRRLVDASAEVAQGSFTRPVPVTTDDEIGELARAFNGMALRLGEVDRMKEQFFAHVSHELRTPLTSIREAAHLLADGTTGRLAPRQTRLVEIVGSSTDRVLRLVNRILDLSRLRVGLLPMERRPVRLQGVTARALLELRPQAEARHVSLVRNGTTADATVLGDEERLVEVAVNLIGNAIKATPAGGTVRVGVEPTAGGVALTVQDSGAGIAPDVLPHIFEPYVQATGAKGGTGLGLAIVKGIVEAHGGRIEAESAPAHGSRFTVVLPRGEDCA